MENFTVEALIRYNRLLPHSAKWRIPKDELIEMLGEQLKLNNYTGNYEAKDIVEFVNSQPKKRVVNNPVQPIYKKQIIEILLRFGVSSDTLFSITNYKGLMKEKLVKEKYKGTENYEDINSYLYYWEFPKMNEEMNKTLADVLRHCEGRDMEFSKFR
jgi:hypothetical protein